ncbi:uncharacterized protein G2W53_034184 [Senna tora]|uniref:Uncharacterized protein n=1 Tax=Senna tora TaxID=362788 RepID=A0A834T0Y8_9FABA|nr:uncharacterized protein G2W53_034184 [Senna tora]
MRIIEDYREEASRRRSGRVEGEGIGVEDLGSERKK